MQKNKNKQNSFIKVIFSYLSISFSAFSAFLITILLLSLINIKNPVFDGIEIYAELISVILSSVLCGIFSCKIKNKAIINGCVTGTFLSLLIFVSVSIFSKLTFNIKELIIIAICIVISSVCAIIKTNFIRPKRRK